LKQLVHYWQLYKTKSTGAIRFYIPMYKILLTYFFLQCEYIWWIQKFQILQCSAIMIITFPLNGRTTKTFNIRHKTQWLQVSSYSKVKSIELGFNQKVKDLLKCFDFQYELVFDSMCIQYIHTPTSVGNREKRNPSKIDQL